MGMVDFSPELNKLGLRWETWKLVCKLKRDGRVNPCLIKDKVAQCQISKPLSCLLAEADIRRKEARKQYLKAKPDAPKMREAFLSERMEIPREKRKEEAARAIQRLLSKAQIRSSWRKIHSLTAKP